MNMRKPSLLVSVGCLAASLLALTGCLESGEGLSEGRPEGSKIETDGMGKPAKPSLSQTELERVLASRESRRGSAGAAAAKSAAAYSVLLVPKNKDMDCGTDKGAIHFDDEDNSNANSFTLNGANYSTKTGYVGGLAHPAGFRGRPGGNTTITVCREGVESLPRMKYDYAVIAGQSTCPPGTRKITRRFDNEDLFNHNWSSNVDPNFAIDHYSEITFCFVPKDIYSSANFPNPALASGRNIPAHYMIFAENHGYAWSGYFGTDDEDDTNNNYFVNHDASSDEFTRFRNIIRGINGGGNDGLGRNTQMFYAATGGAPAVYFSSVTNCPPYPSSPTCTWYVCPDDWEEFYIALAEYENCAK